MLFHLYLRNQTRYLKSDCSTVFQETRAIHTYSTHYLLLFMPKLSKFTFTILLIDKKTTFPNLHTCVPERWLVDFERLLCLHAGVQYLKDSSWMECISMALRQTVVSASLTFLVYSIIWRNFPFYINCTSLKISKRSQVH